MPDIQNTVFIHNAKTVIETENLAPRGPTVLTYSVFSYYFHGFTAKKNPNVADLYISAFPQHIRLELANPKFQSCFSATDPILPSSYPSPVIICPMSSHKRNTKENFLAFLNIFFPYLNR